MCVCRTDKDSLYAWDSMWQLTYCLGKLWQVGRLHAYKNDLARKHVACHQVTCSKPPGDVVPNNNGESCSSLQGVC
jgi:hypothetical protein